MLWPPDHMLPGRQNFSQCVFSYQPFAVFGLQFWRRVFDGRFHVLHFTQFPENDSRIVNTKGRSGHFESLHPLRRCVRVGESGVDK